MDNRWWRGAIYQSCSLLNFPSPDFEEALHLAEEMGFRAIDVTCLGEFHGVDPVLLIEQGGLGAFAAKVRDSGLKVASINSMGVAELAGGRAVDLELCRRRSEALIEMALALDCRNVTSQVEGISSLNAPSRALAVANYQRCLPEFGGMYARAGVQLSFENHVGTCLERPEVLKPLLERNFPSIALTYDPSHLVAQDIPLQESAELLKFAVHCHVRSARPGFIQVPLGENAVDFKWMTDALRKLDYAGAVTIEFFNDIAAASGNIAGLRDRLLELGVGMEIPG